MKISARLSVVEDRAGSYVRVLKGLGASGLNHFKRISRGHEHLRNQRVGIKCYRRDQLIKLASVEQLLLGLSACWLILSRAGSAWDEY